MTWLTATLSNIGLKGLGIAAAVGAVIAVLLGARSAGRNAERVDNLKKAQEIKHAQLEAAADSPRDRVGVVERLRQHGF